LFSSGPNGVEIGYDGYGLIGVRVGVFLPLLCGNVFRVYQQIVTLWLTVSNRIGPIKLKNLCGLLLCENRFGGKELFPLHIFKMSAFANE